MGCLALAAGFFLGVKACRVRPKNRFVPLLKRSSMFGPELRLDGAGRMAPGWSGISSSGLCAMTSGRGLPNHSLQSARAAVDARAQHASTAIKRFMTILRDDGLGPSRKRAPGQGWRIVTNADAAVQATFR